MNMSKLLKGYDKYNQEVDPITGTITEMYAKRLTDETRYLCRTNDKLSLYAEIWKFKGHESAKLYIRAETNESLWCETSYYTCTYEDLDINLEKMEKKLIASWNELNEGE